MPTFPLLSDPATYRSHTFSLADEPDMFARWIDVLVTHAHSLVRHAVDSEDNSAEAVQRAGAFKNEWLAFLKQVHANAADYPDVSVLWFCRHRERLLRAHGFADPYAHIKRDENESVLKLLPDLLNEYDALPEHERCEALIVGSFTGNIFDLGVEATTELFEKGGIDFHAVRDNIKPRPWFIDDFDALRDRWLAGGWKHAVVFVDNSGADVVLGMIPLIRELLGRGTRVVVTGNSTPCLNDITHQELVALIDRIAAFDPVIDAANADGSLSLVPSGNGLPLIDLSDVSEELAAAATGADLVILQGMGRAIETNLEAKLSCDALKLAMLKEPAVYDRIGGSMYDCVCRFEPSR